MANTSRVSLLLRLGGRCSLIAFWTLRLLKINHVGFDSTNVFKIAVGPRHKRLKRFGYKYKLGCYADGFNFQSVKKFSFKIQKIDTFYKNKLHYIELLWFIKFSRYFLSNLRIREVGLIKSLHISFFSSVGRECRKFDVNNWYLRRGSVKDKKGTLVDFFLIYFFFRLAHCSEFEQSWILLKMWMKSLTRVTRTKRANKNHMRKEESNVNVCAHAKLRFWFRGK